MMTRKDYVKVADILNAYKENIEEQIFSDLVSDFGILFKNDNPNFDYTRFRNAVEK